MPEENKNQDVQPQAATQAPKAPETKPEGVTTDKKVIPSDEKYMCAAAYIPGVFIFPMLFKPKSKFCQFHAKQGLGMSALFFIVLFILAIIPMFGSLLFLGYFGVAVVGGMKALGGENWKVPVLGDAMEKVDLNQVMGTKQGVDSKAQETEEAHVPAEEPKTKETPVETPAPVETPIEEPKDEESPAEPTPEAPVEEPKAEETPVKTPTPVETPEEEPKTE